MTYFANCQTIQELKTTYRRLAMQHHPDRGGDLETMKAINLEYEKAFARLQASDTAEAKSSRAQNEMAEEYIRIISILIKLDGLEVELVGSWIWIGGETRKHRGALKAAGCRWASKRMLWFWHPEGYQARQSRQDMEYIRGKYGSVRITADGREEEYRRPELQSA